jgi:hypothetical protein
VQRWRQAHRDTHLTRRKTETAARTPERVAADSARAKVAMALKRGVCKRKPLLRAPCRTCGTTNVTVFIPDLAKWWEVVWLCRDHRAAFIEGKREEERLRREREEWNARCKTALAAIAILPEAQRAGLHEIAARGPAGLLLTPQAPLYAIQLIRAYEALATPSP